MGLRWLSGNKHYNAYGAACYVIDNAGARFYYKSEMSELEPKTNNYSRIPASEFLGEETELEKLDKELDKLINTPNEPVSDKSESVKGTIKNVMSNIVSFAKNLVLSADEKLLRKMGLKNECGDFSCEARDLVMEKLVKANEPYLLEIAKAKQEEDKANKA